MAKRIENLRNNKRYCKVCKTVRPFLYDKNIGHGYCSVCGNANAIKFRDELKNYEEVKKKLRHLETLDEQIILITNKRKKIFGYLFGGNNG